MAVFSYKARDVRGDLVAGTVQAESLAEASRQLRGDGKYVVEITPGVRKADDSKLDAFRTSEAARRAKRTDVIEFCHQISVMLEAGVSLGDALAAFNSQGRGQGSEFQRISTIVEDEVTSGATLSSAMARWPRVFPPIVVTLIKASEASGTMGLMLGRVSKYMGKELKTAKQIKGALTYPCVMIALSLTITIFLMTFVLPRFAAIYSNRKAVLPTPTRIMLAISGAFRDHWPWMLVGLAALAVGFWWSARQPWGRKALDWLRLRAPVLGPMYRKLYLTRSARTMATLIVSGVDLLEAVKITRGMTSNIYFQELWDQVAFDLEQGRPLSSSFGDSEFIAPGVSRMVAAGEHTGRLGPIMERIGEIAEEELDDAIARSTQFIEPAMIGIMGAVVGFVAISMLLPIFTISRAVH